MVDVTIIYVNYKTFEFLDNSIESVVEKTKGLSYEIIVVDNSNNSQEFNRLMSLKKKYNDIIIINAKDNLGFGKGNNLGARYSHGKYLYFLNTDTLLINNAIQELYEYINKNPRIGVVGSNLYNIDLKPNHSFIFKERNIKNIKRENSIFSHFFKLIKIKKRNDFNYTDSPLKIYGYVCGASLMIRKDLFDQMNGFDDDIFMYAEETLLCYNVINLYGKDIYNIPSSKIIHYEGGSFDNFSSKKANMIVDGNYIYYKKAFGVDVAKKFLLISKRSFFKKILFSLIFRKKLEYYRSMYYAYALKYKSLINCESKGRKEGI